MTQQVFLGFKNIGHSFRTQGVARNNCLRNRPFRLEFGETAQIFGQGVQAGGIQRALQGARLSQSDNHFINNLAQARTVR